jgi:hypothetical protein
MKSYRGDLTMIESSSKVVVLRLEDQRMWSRIGLELAALRFRE